MHAIEFPLKMTNADLDRGKTDLVDVCWVVIQQLYPQSHKNLTSPKMTVCTNFKVSNMKTDYDPGGLENKVKVKLVSCNHMSCHFEFLV